MNYNCYLILDLEFDPPVEDQAVIDQRIEEKRKFWARNSNDFKSGFEYQEYLNNLAEMKRIMSDPVERKKQYEAACNDLYAQLDKYLTMLGRGGEITEDIVEKLAIKNKVSVDVVKKRAAALGIIIGQRKVDFQAYYNRYYKIRPDGAAHYKSQKTHLQLFNKDNFYDFLNPGEINGYYNLPCDMLKQRAQEMRKIEFKKSTVTHSSGKKICVACEMAFKDENSKIIYDEYLAWCKRKSILDYAKEIANITDGNLSNEQGDVYIGQLTELFKDRTLAKNVFIAFCKVEKIGYYHNPANENENIKVCRCGRINDVSNRSIYLNCSNELIIKCPKCGAENDANITGCKCGFKFENIDRALAMCKLAQYAMDSMDLEFAKAHLTDAGRYLSGGIVEDEVDLRSDDDKHYNTKPDGADKYVFGIDLGTTNSCIAYVNETGRATVINNLEGANTTPSVVNFASPNQVFVGQVAKENAVIDPENTVSFVKTFMGRSDFAIKFNGDDKSPEEVSAYILKKLTADAAKEIDAEVKDVVITCPAYFGAAERTATKNAGIIAGLNVLEIISELTAAAIYYGLTREQDEKNILVYYLGGGTFDVTIMNINSEKIEVICSDGYHDLGGKDWDAAIMRYLAGEFASQTGYDGNFDEYAEQDLILKAEKAKQQLSSKEEVPVMVDAAGERARINFSRETFDEITSALLNSTIDKTDAAIAVAEERGYKIDEIILVGGSTRMPQVTRALVEKYGIEPKILEPDEAVAKGAAIHAVNVYVTNLGTGGKTRSIVVATTKSFGIETIVNGERKCRNIIFKNNPIPDGAISVSQTFGTMGENMGTIEINVYENDFMEEYFDIDEDYKIGTAILELPGNLPAGAPIEVTFSLNNEGILEVTGKDMTNNKKIKGAMQSKFVMTGESVE